eukprot:EG_transcript_54879
MTSLLSDSVGRRMKLERERTRVSKEEMAAQLHMDLDKYQTVEEGRSDLEVWATVTGQLAINLAKPFNRLLSDSGRWEDVREGQVGRRIWKAQLEAQLSDEALLEGTGLTLQQYQ